MTELSEFFRRALSGSGRVALLGAGSSLMADDAAGVMITDALIERFGEEPGRFRVFSGGTAPECFTGEIKRFRADHVVIIDAADFGGQPGEVSAIDPAVVNGVSFSTHMLPLKVMLDYLNKELGCKTTIIGIQPRCLEFGGEMTGEVKESVDAIIEALGQVLSQ
jgi:hydrogenase 3 maturation protease